MDEFKKKVIRTTTTAGTPLAAAPNPFVPKPVPTTSTPPKRPLSAEVAEILGETPMQTAGFTQEKLDEARMQGIDVFDPHVLRNIAAIDQAAQVNISAQEQAVAAFLEGEKITPEEATAAPEATLFGKPLVGFDPNKPVGFTEEKKAVAFAAVSIMTAVATAGLSVAALGANALRIFVGGVAVGAPMKLINDANNALKGTKTAMDSVINGAKPTEVNGVVYKPVLSPEEAAVQLNKIRDQMNSLERSINIWSKLNPLNYIGGGKDVAIDIQNAKDEYEIKRLALIQAVAAGAIA